MFCLEIKRVKLFYNAKTTTAFTVLKIKWSAEMNGYKSQYMSRKKDFVPFSGFFYWERPPHAACAKRTWGQVLRKEGIYYRLFGMMR
jgi:hypothetical protein